MVYLLFSLQFRTGNGGQEKKVGQMFLFGKVMKILFSHQNRAIWARIFTHTVQ
jgi:hypothetical protein